jgi:hypothetical protein
MASEIWIAFYTSQHTPEGYKTNPDDNIEAILMLRCDYIGFDIATNTNKFSLKDGKDIFWIDVWGKPKTSEYIKTLTIRTESYNLIPKFLEDILRDKGFNLPKSK